MDYNRSSSTWQNVEIPGLAPFSILENALLFKVACLCSFIWVCVRLALGLAEPAWYERLNNNATKRNFLIGAMIGLAFKFITIPSCAIAAYMTRPEDDFAGTHPSMNVYQQTCWGSRGTVTILELVHFTSNRELVFHHGLIIVGMCLIGKFNGPHRGFDLALGALLSEIPNSLLVIFKELGVLSDHPTLDWILPLSSAIIGFAFRVPAIVLAMAMVPATGLQVGPAVVVLVAYFFYLAYILNITWRRLKRAGVWREVGERDFHLRLSSRLIVSSGSFCTGLAALSAQVIALALYSFLAPTTTSNLIEISWLSLLGTLFVVSLSLLLFPRLFIGSWRDLLPATFFKLMFKVAMPNLSKIGLWIFGGWIMLIVVLATLGKMPEVGYNNNMTPAEILARQPALCDLIFSWQFWVCTSSTWLISTFIAQIVREVSSVEEESCLVVAQKK